MVTIPALFRMFLAFEIGLFGCRCFLSGFLSGSFFANALTFTVALALAGAVFFAVAFAGALAVAIVLTAALALAAGSLADQTLSPGDDLVTILGDHNNSTGNRQQGNTDLSNNIPGLHRKSLRFIFLLYFQYNQWLWKLQPEN
jgi:hypothetical protein